MGLRVLGLKEETRYGEAAVTPDWHQDVSKLSASPKSEPVTKAGGSRMIKRARAGVMKPELSMEGDVDLKRIGHYMKAFLGNYKFTDGGSKANIHEFWGGENTKLPSFTGWATFDVMEKLITGLLVDSLKLEVSDEFMTMSVDGIYQTEKSDEIDSETYERVSVDGDIPVMFYDCSVKLGGEIPPGVNSSFTFEGKNNHNVDKTIGLGSRFPQRKAASQQREITLSLVSTLEKETLPMIQAAEYGEVGESPSKCKLYKIPLELFVQICEAMDDTLTVTFPEALFSVEYEESESDEIEVTFNLQTLGTSQITLNDGTTRVTTDMYVKLENDQPEISATNISANKSTLEITMKNNAEPAELQVGKTVKLTNNLSGTVYTAEDTNAEGKTSITTLPYGRYTVEVTDGANSLKINSGNFVSINNTSESLTIVLEKE